METSTVLPATVQEGPERVGTAESEWHRVWSRLARNPMALLGGVVVLAWVVVASLAPWIVPYDPIEQDVATRLAAPSAHH